MREREGEVGGRGGLRMHLKGGFALQCSAVQCSALQSSPRLDLSIY